MDFYNGHLEQKFVLEDISSVYAVIYIVLYILYLLENESIEESPETLYVHYVLHGDVATLAVATKTELFS